jgi:hypothetical protein
MGVRYLVLPSLRTLRARERASSVGRKPEWETVLRLIYGTRAATASSSFVASALSSGALQVYFAEGMDDVYDLQLPTRACLRAACAFSYPTQVWLAHFMERDSVSSFVQNRLCDGTYDSKGSFSRYSADVLRRVPREKSPSNRDRPSMCDVFVNQTLAVARVARVVEFQSEKRSVASNCCAEAYIHSCRYARIGACTHTGMHALEHARTHANALARARTQTHMCTQAQRHARTHTHAHTLTFKHKPTRARPHTYNCHHAASGCYVSRCHRSRMRVGRGFSLDLWNNNAPARKHALGELTAPSSQHDSGTARAALPVLRCLRIRIIHVLRRSPQPPKGSKGSEKKRRRHRSILTSNSLLEIKLNLYAFLQLPL